jgi:hypothetical protein
MAFRFMSGALFLCAAAGLQAQNNPLSSAGREFRYLANRAWQDTQPARTTTPQRLANCQTRYPRPRSRYAINLITGLSRLLACEALLALRLEPLLAKA